jgi:hypothetical protein
LVDNCNLTSLYSKGGTQLSWDEGFEERHGCCGISSFVTESRPPSGSALVLKKASTFA